MLLWFGSGALSKLFQTVILKGKQANLKNKKCLKQWKSRKGVGGSAENQKVHNSKCGLCDKRDEQLKMFAVFKAFEARCFEGVVRLSLG